MNSTDAIDHILVGASTVQSCAAPMMHGFGMVHELCEGLEKFMDQHGFETIDDMIGYSMRKFVTHHQLVQIQSGIDIDEVHRYVDADDDALLK